MSRLPEDRAINSLALSERLGVSHSYLKKTIKALVNEGLVKSSTGKSGGFSLAAPLENIDFYKIFVANIEDTLISTMSAVTLESLLTQVERTYDLTDLDNWIKANI
ncbi:RrF2 family transcriptional regulator [Sporolactobacillus vineae]|uniref:RrF2 family transcriptional regulator n=1 Tax=Sporolactobacillus vineae TaxID=444463 RepID=UPI001EE65E64|nr:Rrf2 family transcriptional regulator [Sporolactobacillus vineae]